MTTINTVDDFLQALDNNPAWREAVRARILGDELLQLPVVFKAFVEQLTKFNEQQAQFNQRVDQFMTLTSNRMQRIESDISVVKGGHVQNHVRRFTEVIADDLELNYVQTLSPKQLLDISKRITSPTGIRQNQRNSFVNADLVIEATAENGETVYVAVEASWTADNRDSDRALRNAGYLENATGHRAIAAVASVRNDHEVEKLIEEGELHWHGIPDNDLQPE